MNLELKRKLFKAQDEERKRRAELEKAQAATEAIKNEIRSNPALALTVTDHALMQYKKRALKEDMQRDINAMLSLCDNAGEAEEQNRGGEMQYVYNTDGPNNTRLTLIIKDNAVITCYVNEKEGNADENAGRRYQTRCKGA